MWKGYLQNDSLWHSVYSHVFSHFFKSGGSRKDFGRQKPHKDVGRKKFAKDVRKKQILRMSTGVTRNDIGKRKT